jgi:hypothetical protein
MQRLTCVIAAALVLGLLNQALLAADPPVTGILIDQMCAGKMMANADPEKSAADHTKACATKDACEKSGYAVIAGKKLLKFDANGDKLAKEFLAKTDKDKNMKVVVEGTQKDDTIAVTSIKPAAM